MFEKKKFEELNWIVKHCQYFECGLLASSPSCFFQCNLIQFDVGRDLNLNIIAKKRHQLTPGKNLSHPSLPFHFAPLLWLDLTQADTHNWQGQLQTRVKYRLLHYLYIVRPHWENKKKMPDWSFPRCIPDCKDYLGWKTNNFAFS